MLMQMPNRADFWLRLRRDRYTLSHWFNVKGHSNMKKSTGLFCTIAVLLAGFVLDSSLMTEIAVGQTQTPVAAAEGLLKRVVPSLAGKIRFEEIPAENGNDVFELQSESGKLVIRGNNGVSMASGLHWYLKHYCRCQISLRARQLELPDPLPQIAENVRIVSPYQYRYYFNYCCFSYTLAWWHWDDWERMIDLMALYGINAPLSVTGQEGVWRNAGKRLGLSEEQMQDFYVGPGFLPFGWMGCIDRWAGPLPNSWIDDHVELQKKILARQRELGMTPILQGFTGHVPRKLQEVNKDVKLVKLSPWIDYEPTYFIDPSDPYFIEVGKVFLEEQTKLFGTDHLYASDSFIEMPPTSNDLDFLSNMGRSIYESMRVADPEAIWVLQSWPFCVHNPEFWLPPQAEAFFRSVPQGRLLIVDLFCEVKPGWPIYEGAFYGQPWVWCILQNFGGHVSLHGGLDIMAADLQKAMEQRGKKAGNLVGIGYIMEGLGWNPIIDEFQSDMIWRDSVPEPGQWRSEFAERWYGIDSPKSQDVWKKLHQTAYQQRSQVGNLLIHRPSLAIPAHGLDKTFVPIWKELLDCADEIGDKRTYHFDVTHVTRHTLGTLAPLYYAELIAAYSQKDRAALKKAAGKLEGLINDIDRQLATHPEFLLGTWLENAKRWGHTAEEKRHYEWNARTILTLWSPTGSLDDYAAKQWAGMMQGYYGHRWKRFFDALDRSLADGTFWEGEQFQAELLKWQADWAKETTVFPTNPSGENPVLVAKSLYEKYAGEFDREFPQNNFILSGGTMVLPEDYPNAVSLTTGKPTTCSDQLSPYPPSLANDGIRNNPDAYWACNADADGNAWWQVDLEKAEEVARVVVVCYYGDSRYYGFIVEGSLDGQNWTVLADKRDNQLRSTIDGYECRFEPQTMRYLRVTQTANSANIGRHLVEVMAFGTRSTVQRQ